MYLLRSLCLIAVGAAGAIEAAGASTHAEVLISEVMYHPPDIDGQDNRDHEYVELVNPGTNNITLFDPDFPTSVWRLSGSAVYAFPTNTVIPAQARVLITGSADLPEFRNRYGLSTNVVVLGPWSGRLPNASGQVLIQGPGGPPTNRVALMVHDQVDYLDDPPWPRGADGYGTSLEKVTLTARGLVSMAATNWQDSVELGGTPGLANSTNIPTGMIRVNEISAWNETLLLDEDKDPEDWFELHNTRDNTLNLQDWYVTDDPDDRTKWRFSSFWIGQNGYGVVFASGKDRPQLTRPHTNFRLDNDGEYLALVRPNGATVEFETTFPDMGRDVTVGFSPPSSYRYLFWDSPGSSNTPATYSTWVSPPLVSPPGGVYTQAVTIVLSHPDPAVTIHYSLDGTPPNTNDPAYSGPFDVAPGTVVRAMALKSGGRPSTDTAEWYREHFLGINELLASNSGINEDGGGSIITDWVEIYNGRSSRITLDGYYITDDLDNRFKHEYPKVNILGQGFHVLYLNTDISGSGVGDFNLSSEGEELALYHPSGALVDHVVFGPQSTDVSLGRQPDGSDTWRFFGTPTWRLSNTEEGIFDNLDRASPPGINLEPGFYTNSQFIVLTHEDPAARIVYTTNGDLPQVHDTEFTQVLHLTETTTIRARAYRPGQVPSAPVTHSYLIGEPAWTMPVVALAADNAHFFGNSGIYTNFIKAREVPMHVEYFPSVNEDIAFSHLTGGRVFGHTRSPQLPFTFAFRDEFGQEELPYQLFKDRPVGLYKRFILRVSGDDWADTFFADALTDGLIGDRMGRSTQAYQPVIAYLNGGFYGYMNLREKLDDHWIKANYGYSVDEIDYWEYEFGRGPEISAGTVDSYNELLHYIQFYNLADPARYAYVESQLNIDSLIDWVVVEAYSGNTSYFHNRKWWRPTREGGKWRWIIFDLDRGWNTLTRDVLTSGIRFSIPEFNELMDNPTFQARFAQRASAHLYTTFHRDYVHQVLNQMESQLLPHYQAHTNRWPTSMEDWPSKVNDIRQTAKLRHEFVQNKVAGLVNEPRMRASIPDGDSTEFQVLANAVPLMHPPLFADVYLVQNVPVDLQVIPTLGRVLTEVLINNVPLTIVDNHARTNFTGTTLTIAVQTAPTLDSLIPEIITHTVLQASGSPWYATGDIVVPANVRLTVEPGVEILMPDGADILVYGELLMQGTAAQPISIRSNPAANARSPLFLDPEIEGADYPGNRWGGLFIDRATSPALLEHVHIQQASQSDNPIDGKGAISSYDSILTLDHVSVEKSGFPVFVQMGDVIMKHSRLHTDVTSDLINVKRASSALVEDCELVGNNAIDTDAIDYDGFVGGIIRSNRIYGFTGFNSDGIDIGEQAQAVEIVGNHIYDIRDKGISVGQGSSVIASHNLIRNCGQAYGIKDTGSYADIRHHTMYGNGVGVAVFEKNRGAGGGTAFIENSIITGSITNAVTSDLYSNFTAQYSLTESMLLPGPGNWQGPAGFISAADTNFYLQAGSPAINHGNPNAPPDPDGTRADMGRFPFDTRDGRLVITEIHYHPALGVSNEYEFIELYNPGSNTLQLAGYHFDAGVSFIFPPSAEIESGEVVLVCTEPSHYAMPELDVYAWTNSSLANEGETLRLFDAASNVVDEVRYNDRAPWPIEADGLGPSLVLIHPALDNALPQHWVASYTTHGTPGVQGMDYTPLVERLQLSEQTGQAEIHLQQAMPGITYYLEFSPRIDPPTWFSIGELRVNLQQELMLEDPVVRSQGYYRVRATYQ